MDRGMKRRRRAFLGVLVSAWLSNTVWANNCCEWQSGDPPQWGCSETFTSAFCTAFGGTWVPDRHCSALTQRCNGPYKNLVPAVSEWGLVFMALLLGTAGLLASRNRRGAAPS